MDCVRRQKRETVLLAPGAGEAIPKADLEKAAARLAESGADLLAVPPQPEPGRPGLDSIAPATLLVDASGVIRRLEPGRLLAADDLVDFLTQWRLGRDVFLTACARCHGDDGALQSCMDVKPLAGIGNRLTHAQVYKRLRPGDLGGGKVLVRGSFFTRQEIEAVDVFVRGL
jgi:mono/diheme cytochrome c family protein